MASTVNTPLTTKSKDNFEYSEPPPPYNEVCSVPIMTATATFQNKKSAPQRICCCTVETWTQVIAALQIFGSIAALVKFIAVLGYKEDPEVDSIAVDSNSDPAVQLYQCFIGLIFGCVLLAGAQLRMPALLLVWLVANGIGLLFILSVLLFLIFVLVTAGELSLFALFVFVMFIFSVQYFCFSVVALHRQEIIQEKNQSRVNVILPY